MPPRKPNAPQASSATASLPDRTIPESLVGQSLDEIEILLGTPFSVRKEKPALVYEYRTQTCSLDVVMFMDIERKVFRALSYDIRSRDAKAANLEQCMDAIRLTKARS